MIKLQHPQTTKTLLFSWRRHQTFRRDNFCAEPQAFGVRRRPQQEWPKWEMWTLTASPPFFPNHVLSKNGHFHSQNKDLQLKFCSNLSSFLSFCNGRIRIRFQQHHSPVFCPKPNLSVKCSLYEGAPADDSPQNNGQDLEVCFNPYFLFLGFPFFFFWLINFIYFFVYFFGSVGVAEQGILERMEGEVFCSLL